MQKEVPTARLELIGTDWTDCNCLELIGTETQLSGQIDLSCFLQISSE